MALGHGLRLLHLAGSRYTAAFGECDLALVGGVTVMATPAATAFGR
nr:hypothetical protein [Mycobacterium tuberculosis]